MPPLETPRSLSRLLLLGALLTLLPARGVADRRPQVVWKHLQKPGARGRVDASSLAVRRAAQTAVNYFNFQQGSPNTLRAPGHVKKASVKIIPGLGPKYHLRFDTKDLLNETDFGSCLASVLYQKSKPKPAVEINCSPDKDRNERLLQDHILYYLLRGDKEPSVQHLRSLGIYGSSLIAWELATEDSAYTLTRIDNALPRKREDDSLLEFYYNLRLSDVAAETSTYCHMRIVWTAGQSAVVKYTCSPEDGSSDSVDGSGAEPGSADDYFG